MNQAVISAQIEALSQLFTEHSDFNNAAAMSAYMRHQFDFFGIKTPLRKQLSKRYLRDHQPALTFCQKRPHHILY